MYSYFVYQESIYLQYFTVSLAKFKYHQPIHFLSYIKHISVCS